MAGERVYGGQTAVQRRAERRERLLDAGLERFGTDGFQATTIEALCAAARLNPRYFYEQFSTREELLAAVYDRHVKLVRERVLGAVAAAPLHPRERLRAGLSAFVTSTLADPRAARVNYFEIVGVSPALEAHRRAVLRAYAELIAAQLSELDPDGALLGGERRMGAMALVGATDGLIIDGLADGRTEDPAAIVDTLVEIFVPERL